QAARLQNLLLDHRLDRRKHEEQPQNLGNAHDGLPSRMLLRSPSRVFVGPKLLGTSSLEEGGQRQAARRDGVAQRDHGSPLRLWPDGRFHAACATVPVTSPCTLRSLKATARS